MSMPCTKNGRNMYDMLSLLQKAIRRGRYRDAAYAANELEKIFRSVMWKRLLVISAEDCFGVLTKELIELKFLDDEKKDNKLVARAIAVMCKALKSRDACYFACNFILEARCPRKIALTDEELKEYEEKYGDEEKKDEFDVFGFRQLSLFDEEDDQEEEISDNATLVATLHKAIDHRDMDMIGYEMNELRVTKRKVLWKALRDYALNKTSKNVISEIVALEKADEFVNSNKKDGEKDEIFISKAVMILCYANDESIKDVRSSDIVSLDELVDWSRYQIKNIEECHLENNEIPEWVFDCHTLRGKRMGKTDWDMTIAEQEGLNPKAYAYFDEGSWLYIYEQDVRLGVLDEKGFAPIKEFAKTHEANPVKFIPYE